VSTGCSKPFQRLYRSPPPLRTSCNGGKRASFTFFRPRNRALDDPGTSSLQAFHYERAQAVS